MQYTTRFICLFWLIFISSMTGVFAADLQTTLQKIPVFKSFTEMLGAGNANEGLVQLKKKFAEGSPNQASLIYEGKVDNRPCEHCPKFLKLTEEVNKIVEKVKGSDSITEANEQLVQVNKLKFLYYIVRSESDTGEITCKKRGEKGSLKTPVLDGQFKIITETVMDSSAVSDVQFIPQAKGEVYYYYRGDGANSNVIIEVKMNKDGTSRMRYFDYTATGGSSRHLNLPNLPGDQDPSGKYQAKKNGNYLEVDVALKTGDNMLPNDISFVSAGTQIKLADDLKITIQHQASFNQQTTSIYLANDKGTEIVNVSGTYIPSGKKTVIATLPMEVTFDAESAMTFKGSISNEFSLGGSGTESNTGLESKRTVTLGLTDKNHEYITITADSRSKGPQQIDVSNKYKLGESSSIGAGYKQASDGTKNFNLNNVVKLDNYGTLTTSFSRNTKGVTSVQTQLEKKISETSSMVVNVKTDSQGNKVFLYQFKKVY